MQLKKFITELIINTYTLNKEDAKYDQSFPKMYKELEKKNLEHI